MRFRIRAIVFRLHPNGCSICCQDGTEGTQDDSDVREVVGKVLIYVFWEREMHLLRKTLPDVRRR